MSWARYDDELSMNKKIGRLRAAGVDGIAAVGLHLLANTYCRHNGTAGEVEAHVPELLAGKCGPKLARLLAEVGMFDATESGWWIHDFEEFHDPADPNPNRSAADRKRELSEKRSAAGRKGGLVKPSKAPSKDEANDKQNGSIALANGVANGKQKPSPVPVPVHTPITPLRAAPQAREANPLWDSLTEHFGEPATKTEKTNRGRQVRELKEAGATAEDVHARITEHNRRGSRWTMTADALVKHWSDLDRKQAKTSTYDPDTGAMIASTVQW